MEDEELCAQTHFECVTEIKKGRFEPKSRVAKLLGQEWELCEDEGTVYRIVCNAPSQNTHWSYKVRIELVFLDDKRPERAVNAEYREQFEHVFTSTSRWFDYDLTRWRPILEVEHVELLVRMSIVTAVPVDHHYHHHTIIDFSEERGALTDVSFLIGDATLHANKSILAFGSPVFERMLFSSQPRNKKPLIRLDDVDYEEFENLLALLHGHHLDINARNVRGIMRLASRYECREVISKCHKELLTMGSLDIAARLMLAEKYKLVKLQEVCIDAFSQMTQIQKKTVLYAIRADEITAKTALLLARLSVV